MPKKLVLRDGKLSFRADGRLELTGDDGACPADCNCFACRCSNSGLFDDGSPTLSDLPLKEPCPAQSENGTDSCIPLQLQATFPALTPVTLTYPYSTGGTITYTLSPIPAISLCMKAGFRTGIGPQPSWGGRVTRGFKVVATHGSTVKCFCATIGFSVFVAKSQAVTGGSGVSLFVREILQFVTDDVFNQVPTVIGFSSETDLTLNSNFICANGTTTVTDTGSTYLLPPTVVGYASSDPVTIRACATCANVAAEAGNCTETTIGASECANVTNPPPPTPHCFYLVTADKTGGTDDSPTWGAWSWDSTDPDATFIGDVPPPPFTTIAPTVYRTTGGICRAAMWIDGGEAPTDGSDCPGLDEDDYPDALTSATKCPTAETVACPTGKCISTSWMWTNAPGGTPHWVMFGAPSLPFDCDTDGDPRTIITPAGGGWQGGSGASYTAYKSFCETSDTDVPPDDIEGFDKYEFYVSCGGDDSGDVSGSRVGDYPVPNGGDSGWVDVTDPDGEPGVTVYKKTMYVPTGSLKPDPGAAPC